MPGHRQYLVVVGATLDHHVDFDRAQSGALRRFDASEPSLDQSPTAVAPALKRAANRVAAEVAQAHQQGRRLYIGTTAAESKRFVIWDIGEIACRGRPQDRALIKQILLGSSAIPGVFPPVRSGDRVLVDGGVITPVPVRAVRALSKAPVLAINLQGDYQRRAEACLPPGKRVMTPFRVGRAGLSLLMAHLAKQSLVIDPGSRTFDWLVARGMKLSHKQSYSVDRGVSNILQLIADDVSQDIGRPYTNLDNIDLEACAARGIEVRL